MGGLKNSPPDTEGSAYHCFLLFSVSVMYRTPSSVGERGQKNLALKGTQLKFRVRNRGGLFTPLSA